MSASAVAKFDQIAGFHQLLEAASDAMVVTRSDGRIVGVNTKTEELFGYSREEMLGQKPEMLMPRQLAHLRWSRFRKRYVKQHTAYDTHLRLRFLGYMKMRGRRRDGSEFPMEISVGMVEIGPETLLSSSIQDITERTKTQELAAHLANMVDSSSDAIIGKTLDGTIVSWNKAAENLYGYKAEEMLGHRITALIPPDKPNEFAEIMKQLRRGQSLESYETTRIHKDGHPIEVSVTISPVKNKAGKIVGASVVARDISKQKQAEAALLLSEERFRVAIKNAPIGVFTQDLQLRYTWITPPLMAWDDRDYVGCTDAELFGGEQGARLTAIKQEVLRSGMGSHNEVPITYEGVTKYFDLLAEPFRDAGGTLLGIISSAVDITHWNDLIVKLQEALDQVRLLSGLLPICASCKKIRDEEGNWQQIESYISKHSEAEFSHGMCPACGKQYYGELWRETSKSVR